MSLKAFHILFIALSIVLSAGLGAWGVESYLSQGSRGGLAFGVVFFLTGAALLVYGVKFLQKMREIEP
ncbi:MAG: hypothetical protein R3244_04335 [Thermoanaerobaculia bacterium]|nr:hypothetical protein [Thermoanaerobaculia bacterium]